MKLTFLTGRAGAGKTAHILGRVAESVEMLEKTILIVPEQFTFSAERLLLNGASGGLLFTQVLSPSRLAYRVLTNVGGMKFKRLDSSGAVMAVRKALFELRGELRHFGRARNLGGVAPLMADMIAKFRQTGIRPDDILRLSKDLPDSLRNKMSDIALVFDRYEKNTDAEYADAQKQEQLLVENLSRADFLREYDVFVDGFDVIAPLTLKMLAALASVAKSVTVSFTCGDENDRDAALFKPVRDTMKRLSELAAKYGIAPETVSIGNTGFRSPAIGHIERELFAIRPKAFEGETEAVELAVLPNIETEAVAVAARIVRLAREKGIPYGEMAVVTSDGGERAEEIKRQLDIRGVPCRLDKMDSAADHSAVRLILSALSCANRQMMERQDVLSVLKSGWLGISMDGEDLFENEIIERNIFGSRFREEMADERLESIRIKLAEPIFRLSAQIRKEKTAQGFARAAYGYIEETGILGMLSEKGEGQLAQTICDVLDQSFALLGEMPLRDYINTLSEGFSAARTGSIPHQSDSVSIGSLARFKGDQPRALFVMGMNDGLIPSSSAPDSILSDYEIIKLGADVSGLGTGSERFFEVEKLSIYDALTQPREFLHISMSRSGEDGAALEPSPIFRRFERIFPNVRPKNAAYYESCDALLDGKASAKKLLGLMLRKSADPGWRTVKDFFARTEPLFMERLDSAMRYTTATPPLASGAAKNIYGGRISISRLESFAACPYGHFLKYGLKPIIRKEPLILPADAGSYYHDFLESVTREVFFSGGIIPDSDKIREIIGKVSNEQTERLLALPAGKTPEGKASAHLLEKNARRAAENVIGHIALSDFKPLSAEIRFGQGGDFPAVEVPAGDTTLFLEGRIDRVDAAVIGGEKYARIVDYKSGRNALLFADVADGTGLQLVTYLSAVSASGFRPAGAFYLHVSGKMKRLGMGDEFDINKLAEEMRRGYRLEGVAIDDRAVFDAMRGENKLSDLVNINLTKAGTPYKGAPVLSAEKLGTLMDFVREKEKTLASRMLEGEISLHPLKNSRKNACEYCDGKSACPFEAGMGCGYRYASANEKDAKIAIFGGEEDD